MINSFLMLSKGMITLACKIIIYTQPARQRILRLRIVFDYVICVIVLSINGSWEVIETTFIFLHEKESSASKHKSLTVLGVIITGMR